MVSAKSRLASSKKRAKRAGSAKPKGSTQDAPEKKSTASITKPLSRKRPLAASLIALPGAESTFSGTLNLTDSQASLDGTLLLLGDGSDVAANINAAADSLSRQGFYSGQSVSITGTQAVVHFNDHPLQVIFMTDASSGS